MDSHAYPDPNVKEVCYHTCGHWSLDDDDDDDDDDVQPDVVAHFAKVPPSETTRFTVVFTK